MSEFEKLVEDSRSGKPEAAEALVHRHLPELLPRLERFVGRRMGSLLLRKEEVGDLVLSTCREILMHASDYRDTGPEGLLRWLYRSARRKLVDRHRYHLAERRRVDREAGAVKDPDSSGSRPVDQVPGSQSTPSEAAMRAEERRLFREEAARLPDHLSRPLLLLLEGLSLDEIGRALGIPKSTIRNRVDEARARVADRIARQRPPGGAGADDSAADPPT